MNLISGFGSYSEPVGSGGTGKANASQSMRTAAPSEDQLGTYVFALNPYKAVYPPPGTWANANPPAVVTFVADPTKPHDYLYSLDACGIEHDEKPGEWRFKYADHYVHRALRIPYRYYKASETLPDTGVLVKDYLMVGFEGGMGY